MAFACFSTDVSLRNLTEKRKFGGGEALSGTVDLILAGRPFNARTEVNDEHSERNVFGLIDMKYIAMVLGGKNRNGVHRHVFALLYDLLFGIGLFLRKKRKAM